MPTYKVSVEYQGTRYSGWQEQRNARTVAGEVRAAMGRVAGRVVELGGAGRTDAGVHALGQVAHLRVAAAIDPEPFRRAVNDILPSDIHLAAIVPADDRFHARHEAVLRSYVYQVAVRRTVFARKYTWWVKRPLDAEAMARAAALCVGRHDFALLSEPAGEDAGTLVHVERAEVVREGGLIVVRFAASHFLWKMVRRTLGVLVRIGAGEWDVEDMERLLDGALPRFGTVAEGTAPPAGLFLERVLYAGDPPLEELRAPFPVAGEPPPPRGPARAGERGRRGRGARGRR